jgi:hypothetical protein
MEFTELQALVWTFFNGYKDENAEIFGASIFYCFYACNIRGGTTSIIGIHAFQSLLNSG